MSYTVVIPAYNSENKVDKFSSSLFSALSDSPEPVEFIFVDDGSADGTWQVLKDIKFHHPTLYIRLLRLQKNYGQLAASSCGIMAASNDLVVTIDDDGKYNPGEIPLMIDFWRKNKFKLVFGTSDAEQRTMHKSAFYFIIRRVLFPKFSATSFSSFRVFSKSSLTGVFQKSLYGGNLHTLWLFKPTELGSLLLASSGYSNPASRYSFFGLILHQKYLIAYLLFICAAVLSLFSILLAGLYHFRHLQSLPMPMSIPVISVIFTVLAYLLLRFWVAGSFKFTVREKV